MRQGWNTYLTSSAGKNKEGEAASGTITVPEIAHDTEEDEYVVCFPLRSTWSLAETTLTHPPCAV